MESVSESMDEVRYNARRAGNATMGFVRENAVPLALMGLGAAWLFANKRNSSPYSDDYYYSPRRQRLHDGAERVREEVSRTTDKARRLASDATHRAGDLAHRAEHAIEDGAHRARDVAQREYVRARDASRDLARENPLALGAVAIAAGFGIGLLLPHTNKEDELLGGTRDRLLGEAQSKIQEVKEVAKDVAKDVTREAKNTLSSTS